MAEGSGKRELGKSTLDAIASARTVPSVPSPDSTGPKDPMLASADTVLAEGSVPSMPRLPQEGGEVLGNRYEILGELGRGGEGVVYRARDLKADAIVALKLLQEDEGSKSRLPRFRRELQMARKVTHPNVVRIHDLVELPGRFGLTMELVEGEPLDDRLARGSLPRDEVVRLAVDLARALAAAHEAGVTHRDLKPGNVLLRARDGHAVVTDFGVSRAHGAQEITPAQVRTATPLALTREGILIGTPQYMALEQLEARTDIGPPADVYAFGLVVYEAATGSRVHEAETYAELLRLRRECPPVRLREKRPDLPRVLCDAVDRALARDPGDRFASGVELLAAIEPLAGRRRGVSAPLWLAGAVILLGMGAAAGWYRHGSSTAAKQPLGAPGPRTRPLTFHVNNPTRLTFGNGCEEFPSFTPDGKSIVYDGTVGADAYLFRLDLPGGTPRPLTQVHGWDMAATISPSGDRIAFLRFEGEHIGTWVAPLDGHEPPHWIAAGSVRPSWSRDGKGVWAGTGAPITEYDANGGAALRTLGSAPSSRDAHTTELPDGSLVILYSGLSEEHQDGLALVDTGGGLRWLSRESFEEVLELTPDARHVISLRSMNTGTFELFDVPIDGSPAASLSASGIPAKKGLDLAPDGKHVTWSTCSAYADMPSMDAKGHLSEPIGDVELSDWSSIAAIPGTGLLAVVSPRAGKEQPWIHDVAGHAPPRPIAMGDMSVHEIAVSLDGRQFVVSVVDKGLYVGSLQGTDPQLLQLTHDPIDARPSFRVGGAQILFTRQLAGGKPQVFAIPTSGGEAAPLLPPGSDDGVSAPKDDRIAYLAGDSIADAVPMIRDGRTGVTRPLSPALGRGRYGGLRFSPDGKQIALARGDTEIIELDASTGAVLRTVKNPSGYQLAQPTYTPAGLVVQRTRWQGNIWMADAQLQE